MAHRSMKCCIYTVTAMATMGNNVNAYVHMCIRTKKKLIGERNDGWEFDIVAADETDISSQGHNIRC